MRRIKKAFIEITSACNLACAFCPGTVRPHAFMTEHGFAAALESLGGGVQSLYFHVMGEPLLHPRLGALLKLAARAGLPVNITTNGTLLGQAKAALLGEAAPRQVSISLHSMPEYNETYMDEALRFARAARASGRTLVALRLWNEGGGDARVAAAVIARLAREFGLNEDLSDAPAGNRGITLADGIYLNRARTFAWPDMDGEDFGESGFCMGLRDQIGILCDGTAVPCCLDGQGAVPLGNIFFQNLGEILSGERARRLYEGFTRRKAVEELCRRCGYRKRFE